MNSNTGHGHVWARPDGVKVCYGGPALCAECRRDAAAFGLVQPDKPRVEWTIAVEGANGWVGIGATCNDATCNVQRKIWVQVPGPLNDDSVYILVMAFAEQLKGKLLSPPGK